jgi:phosphoglycolate phosphatase-like HAD superfamily hydrolase
MPHLKKTDRFAAVLVKDPSMSSSVCESECLPKRHDRLICIDSDGTVFDTMPVKHRFFRNCLIRCFGLHGRDAECAAEVWDSVNLRSVHRGENRFRSLLIVLDLLRKRGVAVPDTFRLRAWIQCEPRLGNPALRDLLERDFSEEMNQIYRWSRDSDEAIAANVYGVTPFPLVRETLESASARADVMVVSHTPCAALEREWSEHALVPFVMRLGGQECGSKTEQIRRVSMGKYSPEHMLMIGDSSGDLNAAAANRALFFPVVPGRETESWRELAEEGLARFFEGRFAGDYQKKLLDAFSETQKRSPQ